MSQHSSHAETEPFRCLEKNAQLRRKRREHQIIRKLFSGYDAYFGTYTLNEKEGIVTHHLEAAIWPGDIGKDIDRHFRISGDRLTVTFNTTTKEGVKVTRILVWERMR
jgi:hypothetical protein